MVVTSGELMDSWSNPRASAPAISGPGLQADGKTYVIHKDNTSEGLKTLAKKYTLVDSTGRKVSLKEAQKSVGKSKEEKKDYLRKTDIFNRPSTGEPGRKAKQGLETAAMIGGGALLLPGLIGAMPGLAKGATDVIGGAAGAMPGLAKGAWDATTGAAGELIQNPEKQNWLGKLIGGSADIIKGNVEADINKAEQGRMADRAKRIAGQGEAGLYRSLSEENPNYQAVVGDIQANAQRGQDLARRNMATTLAQQGVRGGQAAVLTGRATGDVAQRAAQDINKLKYEDYAAREQARRRYEAGKAAQGTSGLLNIQPKYR